MAKVTVLGYQMTYLSNICNLIKVLILKFDNHKIKIDKIDVKYDKNDVILLKMTHFTENDCFKNNMRQDS